MYAKMVWLGLGAYLSGRVLAYHVQNPVPSSTKEKEKVIRLNKLSFSPNILFFRLSFAIKFVISKQA